MIQEVVEKVYDDKAWKRTQIYEIMKKVEEAKNRRQARGS
jgi:hypothetical protein